ncbi:MAG TPA: flagellar biosynthesis anti-sigma factor FlgM [Gammaproteobacteria bacterium]
MEIRDTSNNKIDTRRADAQVETRIRPGASEERGRDAASGAERVTLTKTAQELLKGAAGANESGAPVDRQKVAALKEAIAAGTYRPSGAEIAAKLFEFDNPPTER